jgi:hypothetical protein
MAQDQRDGRATGGAQSARTFPPRMTRSQPQLATVYAPGSIFTWEGGRGACLSVPIDGAAIDFSARQTRRDQIMESLQEFCQNWLARGMAIVRDAAIYEQQLLDGCFHNPMRQGHASVDIALDRFEFLRPERMGYLPGPLVYRCDTCALVREYVSPAHQVAEPLPITCVSEGDQPAHDSRWRQLDVVYAHWSGGIEGLSPYRYTMDRGGSVQKIPRCQCGAENFRLIKQGNQFSRWRFVCTGCSSQREVYQTDPFSLNLLKPLIDAGAPHQWSEINMIPVSYRASPVFYVQTARFIVFDTDPEVITLMGPAREDDLASRVAMLHGFAGTDPSDERIKEQLERNAQGSIFAPYEMFRAREAAARAAGDAASVDIWADAARSTLNGWYDAGLVSREVSASPALQVQVRARGGYARRYDPIRSTVEHDALRRRKVNLAGEAANLKVAHPDLCAEFETVELQRAYERRVADDLVRAGIEDARLIRNLDMVEFSFGFSRVSATPETTQKDRRMPVRLMGFPPLPSNKRPIYVIEQQNEAIYIQLNAGMVAAFLQRNGVLAQPPTLPRTIGGSLIESYQDFGLFLKDFSVRDEASRVRARDIASMTYLLVHSMAHHVMHGIARFSGLDLGSLSEVIFPADLAFVVHRRGMTEDLGNISSMWRDQNSAFLRYLVARRELRCGSGTLCDHRGGACPACIMIPETSCIAGNQLLSRAALVGGRAPLWDANQAPLQGFFEVVQDIRQAGAPPAPG